MNGRAGGIAEKNRVIDLALLGALLAVLVVTGGASRADELGQVMVRCAAIVAMLVLCMTRRTWDWHGIRLPLAWLALVAGVVLVQLVPLPPLLWTALPGRAPFEAAIPVGPQPWRPINLTPDGGLNTFLSLSVPMAVLTILAGMSRPQRARVLDFMLAAIVFSALLGSLQLAGAGFVNPFVNNNAGEASGLFANRNHQALLLSAGLPLLALWAFRDAGKARPGRWLSVAGVTIWFLFLILATGSRAGIGLVAIGLAAFAVIALQGLRQVRIRWPRWALPAALATVGSVLGAILLVSLASDRAQSLMRLTGSGEAGDIRFSALPLLRDIVLLYFPFGSGFGSFDPVFRIAEPFALLNPSYFNHAHNDAVELFIEAGLAGLAIVGFALFIWVRLGIAGFRQFRKGGLTGFAGWSVLTLILVASLVDYPARTPMIMAFAMLAAWLAGSGDDNAALPS